MSNLSSSKIIFFFTSSLEAVADWADFFSSISNFPKSSFAQSAGKAIACDFSIIFCFNKSSAIYFSWHSPCFRVQR
ncbi:hypothetical protein A2553_03160 [Candidatus Nomurabacteria bacterium RIFOXYD2_FULL_42_12]|nr:MAG: hypothetical protein A2553_03160 [Candidatus Nomurabacteria bacterium RIFOXYD2_FULL_42_12]